IYSICITYIDLFNLLKSYVQMPGGIPVATTAIGKAGAKNAGILAARILGISHSSVRENLENYEKSLVQKVEEMQNELQ
ncbi:AIR carboxylase family protein, partial [Staphylococcus warneri]